MRKCPLVLVMVALLLIGHPALAKGPLMVDAEISGPGLVEPLSLRDHFGPGGTGTERFEEAERFRLLAEQSKVYEGLYSDRVGPRPPGELGPRYTIRWSAGFVAGPTGTVDRLGRVTTYLYPYAEAGPVTLIPAQEIAGMQIQRGWHAAVGSLVDDLEAWGLPTLEEIAPPQPVRDPARDSARSVPASEPAPWLLVVVIIAGLGAALVAGLALKRDPAI